MVNSQDQRLSFVQVRIQPNCQRSKEHCAHFLDAFKQGLNLPLAQEETLDQLEYH